MTPSKLNRIVKELYKTDMADVRQLFRLIQSISSPKAEPFKIWLAEIARERLEEIDTVVKDIPKVGLTNSSNPLKCAKNRPTNGNVAE